MDFKAIIQDMQAILARGPDAAALVRIRSGLDDPAFRSGWKEYLKTTNDFDERDECISGLTAIRRLCGDRSGERGNELTNVRFFIGLGGSMVAGGIIALGTAAVGAFFVIPIFTGAIAAAFSLGHTGRLQREEKIYKDIEAQTAALVEESDGK